MRQLVLTLVALTGTLWVQDSAAAGERQFLIFVWDDGQPTYSQPQSQYYESAPVQQYGQPPQPTFIYEQRPGLFQQVIEMEHRKNAWLRRTFLGRN